MTLESRALEGDAAKTAEVLAQNAEIYDILCKHLSGVRWDKQPETAATMIQLIAEIASSIHPGRFADGRLDNVGLDLAKHLDSIVPAAWPASLPAPARSRRVARRHVLHVTSALHRVGGHTRSLKNWILMDRDSVHSVAVTCQSESEQPEWLASAIEESGGGLYVFPKFAPMTHKAQWLRTLSRHSDLVLLQYANDAVPLVALGIDDCPPVGIVNQCDHSFWLGSSIADMIVNLRNVSHEINESRRFAACDHVVPIPLTDASARYSKLEARRLAGIPGSQLVLLSVGRAPKYRPTGVHNFCRSAARILAECPAAHLYVVGLAAEDLTIDCREWSGNDRLHLLGRIEDPSVMQAAADVYIESVPFGSQTALLESCLPGVPAVLGYAPSSPLHITEDDCLSDLAVAPADEAMYIGKAVAYLNDKTLRESVGAQLGRRIRNHHLGEGWHKEVTGLYDAMSQLEHAPRRLPESEFEKTELDLALAGLLEGLHMRAKGRVGRARFASRLTRGAAYWVRKRGEGRGAIGMLALSDRLGGQPGASLGAMAKVVAEHCVHRTLPWLPKPGSLREPGAYAHSGR